MTGRSARVSTREAGLRMERMDELIAAATLVVTAAGLWFAYSYSRQMDLKLSESSVIPLTASLMTRSGGFWRSG
jgi:hypothetical protein